MINNNNQYFPLCICSATKALKEVSNENKCFTLMPSKTKDIKKKKHIQRIHL